MTFTNPGIIGADKVQKSGPYDSVLQSKYTHTIWDAFFIIFHLYNWIMSRKNFDAIFGLGN